MKKFVIEAEFVETCYTVKQVAIEARTKKEALDMLARGDYQVVQDNLDTMVVECYQMDNRYEEPYFLTEEEINVTHC